MLLSFLAEMSQLNQRDANNDIKLDVAIPLKGKTGSGGFRKFE